MSLLYRVMSKEERFLSIIIENSLGSSILRVDTNTSKNGILNKVNVLVPCQLRLGISYTVVIVKSINKPV